MTLVVAARQAALVAGNGVLVRLDAPAARRAQRPEVGPVLANDAPDLALPAQRQVRRRHDLKEVHKVELAVPGVLARAVQRVQVVVGPGQPVGAEPLGHVLGQLRPEPQRVDDVREVVLVPVRARLHVAPEVVDVRVAVAEAAARREVEVAHHLVDAEAPLDAAALLLLLRQPLRVVLALALLDVVALEGPALASVGVADFLARVAAARLLRVFGRLGAITLAAVFGVEVDGKVLVTAAPLLVNQRIPGRRAVGLFVADSLLYRIDLDDTATILLRLESDLAHTLHDAVLLFAGYVHNVECEQLTRDLGEGHVEMDLHALA